MTQTLPPTETAFEAQPTLNADEPAIVVEDLTKVYRTYSNSLARAVAPFRKKETGGRFVALDHVTTTFERGEVVAILGRNGSGKSTLAKIIAGVTTPTSGRVHANGRISAMLELTSGFDPELSGIENIYLRALVMGMSREEADAKLDEIIRFADIGDHINQPVRTYSSGMKSRLGFAVSVSVDPDILIVDEVLAVGDDIFRLKCIDKMGKIRESGRTILFISHSLGTVKAFCTKAIWINRGVLEAEGDVGPVVRSYEEFLKSERATARTQLREVAEDETPVEKSDVLQVRNTRLTSAAGIVTNTFEQGEDIFLEFTYEVKKPITRLTFTYTLTNSEDVEIFASDKQSPDHGLATSIGTHRVRARLVRPPLVGGGYRLSGELWNNTSGLFVNHSRDRRFTITQSTFTGTGIAQVECELTND
jgi:teichoic acid transport system ATP-binding protein